MARRLYLDTARLGLMRRGAQRLYQDFVRLAGEEGCTLYWEEFLNSGYHAWPDQLRHRYPALQPWSGIAGLKAALRQLVAAQSDSPVLLANRSALLMRLAAKVLFTHCRNVLVTDLSWPPYLKHLRRERCRGGDRLTVVKLRNRLLEARMETDELVNLVCSEFEASNCDGLFLPAVDHRGVRLPVAEIIRAIRQHSDLRFSIVDGAQAIAHVPVDVTAIGCDFFIAGCHKWLGAYHPLGIAVLANPHSGRTVQGAINEILARRHIDDPLLRFTQALETGVVSRYGETVNVAPMFTAQGALHDISALPPSASLRMRITNAERLVADIDATGWTAHIPGESLRTAILLLEAPAECRHWQPRALRASLHEHGIAATTYPRGLLRLSMPAAALTPEDLRHITRTLCSPRLLRSPA